ncbi:MAG: sulfite exporter TauE/SafE family protein [Flavobacteriaceae bacterium]|nr:sulfite exporter TauE/SafE family protein [Flavobacteriaceae bacterium]
MGVSAFILGFVGSLHCIGMCGPIAFMLPLDRSNPIKQGSQVLSYHLGRILTYGILGLLFGLVGSGLQLFGWQQKLSIGIGSLMIFAVIWMYLPFKKWSLSPLVYKLIRRLKNGMGGLLTRKSTPALFVLGLLNGLLPCGLVYVALMGAIATGDPLGGAFFMMLFGLGTVPLMTVAVYSAGFLKGRFRIAFQKLIPAMILLFGALLILRGLGLGIPYLSPAQASQNQEIATEIECH